ncbi:MAG: protein-disulfide reductase DsbD family protein [Flammeovirgaceae bacterium]
MKQFFKINRVWMVMSFVLLSLPGYAQILQPVKWSTDVSKKEVKVGETIELLFKANIEKDWFLYSTFSEDIGPIPTTVSFEANNTYELVGELTPIDHQKKFDDLWEAEITYFKGEGLFSQKVKVLSPDFNVKVALRSQTCSDIDGKCILINEDFTFTNELMTISAGASSDTPKDDNNEKKQFTASSAFGDLPISTFLFLAFLGGLTAIFTPCVFPMIPLTVSLFSGKGKGKSHAFFYGFSIIAIYAIVGAICAPLLGPEFANVLSTHWASNTVFFTVFIVFALSFFGLFDIQLPSSFVNKMDSQSDKKGGYVGVFFMAFTLTLVSFSCTGPIVGSLLVASAGGEFTRPILGMAVFGAAFALPFMFFALFPRSMDKLPKSGGWLNSVKVTLGFIELALAFKFLSMIDLVYHLGILDRDMNIAIWIAIFSFMGLYYLGKIQLPHDSPVEKISVPRMLLALTCFTFVIYLMPGMFGAPLKALSGLLPPSTTHDFDLNAVVRENSGWKYVKNNKVEAHVVKHKYEGIELPHGFTGYFNYEEGLAAAKKAGKPIMLDFTGHGCANCRKMEDNVWVDPAVRQRLENDWVIVELYVDDRTELPEEQWVLSKFDGKLKKTVGEVNMDFEITRFENNAQPLYVLLDHDGELLADGKGYDPSIPNFIQFLDNGLAEFKKRH